MTVRQQGRTASARRRTAAPAVAPTFVSATSAQSDGTASLSIAKPAGAAVGHVLYIWHASDDNPPSGITGATFVQLASTGASGYYTRIYRRVLDGTEPSSFTLSADPFADASAVALCVAGADTASPEAVAVGTVTGSGTSMAAPSMAPAMANTLLLCGWTIRPADGVTRNVTPPASMTERADTVSTYSSMSVASETITAAGATGTRTATAPVSLDWLASSISVRPASG